MPPGGAIRLSQRLPHGIIRTGHGLRHIREDNSRKPSYEMLKKLVKQEWWTDTTVKTDENGWAEIEAFKGDYQISAEGRKAEVSLTDNAEMILALRD